MNDVERTPLVSVIIPFYNCRYVDKAIESVLNQTYKNIEIILINDGSTQFQELIHPYLKDIRYIEQPNQGVAAALNQGLRHANGEYIAWLSSDDLFAINKVAVQLKYMMEQKLDISFTNFNHIDENNKITRNSCGINFLDELHLLTTLRDICPINGCTIMMSPKVVKTIGYFNETLKYTQDYDYWIRTSFHFPIHYLPTILTYYRVHKEMGSLVHYKEQMEEFHMIKEKYRNAMEKLIAKKATEKTR